MSYSLPTLDDSDTLASIAILNKRIGANASGKPPGMTKDAKATAPAPTETNHSEPAHESDKGSNGAALIPIGLTTGLVLVAFAAEWA